MQTSLRRQDPEPRTGHAVSSFDSVNLVKELLQGTGRENLSVIQAPQD